MSGRNSEAAVLARLLGRTNGPVFASNPLGLDRTEIDGRIETVPEFDDSPGYQVENTPNVKALTEAESSGSTVFQDRTGEVVPSACFKKLRERDAVLHRQSHETARKLEAAGIGGYQGGASGLFLIDPVRYAVDPTAPEVVQEQPRYRRCNFIPAIAKQKRVFSVRLLEFWLERNPYARFWTFTSGTRCTIAELRDRIQDLHRKISRLNAEPFMKDAGAEIVFRATETGSLTDEEGVEQRNDRGEWLFHPHSHCLVQLCKGRMSVTRWKDLLGNVWAYMGHNWDEGGQIETVRECCKYVVKPADVLRLNSQETAELHRALSKLHLVQPLGAVKRLKDEILDSRDTLTYLRPIDGGPAKLQRVPNWNRQARRKPAPQDADLEEIYTARGENDEKSGAPVIVATLPPGPYFDRVLRPGVLVSAASFSAKDMRDIMTNPKIQRMVAACLEQYQAGEQLRRAEVRAAAEGQGGEGLPAQASPLAPLLGYTHIP